MKIWAIEINELKNFHESIEGQFPTIDKELKHLFKTKDANVVLLYSRRCLEVIISDVCECELKRPRKTEPLQGIIDRLNKEGKIPPNIITSMLSLNSFSTYGAHPMDFDPEQVKPVLNNLAVIIRWYKKYKDTSSEIRALPAEEKIPEGGRSGESGNQRTRYARASISSQKAGRGLKILISLALVICLFGIVIIIVRPGWFSDRKKLAKTIAVIPFRNLANDPAKSFFCDGFMEEILNDLQKVRSLTVRSRTSSSQYRDPGKSSSVIGRELNVNYLIEGSVGWEGDSIKIWVQLIEAKVDKHLWSDEYVKDTNQIFALQNEISRKIANELKAILTPEEIRSIEKKPTGNTIAYTKLLSGNYLYNDATYFVTMGKKYNDSSSFQNAINAYSQAIKFDTTFALAYAKRAISRSWGYYTGALDKSQIQKCKEDIDKALKFDPDLIEIQIASGFYYYYCLKDYKKAIGSFRKAIELEPGNSEPFFYLALVYRRLGEWGESQRLLLEVLNDNLNSALILTNIGLSYCYMRDYDSALIYHDKAIRIMPGWRAPYHNKAETCLLKYGRTREARIILDSATLRAGRKFMGMKIDLEIYDNRYPDALQLLQMSRPSDFENQGWMYLYSGEVHNYLNNTGLAHAYYDSARIWFADRQQRDPENSSILSSAGIAFAGLNNKNAAIDLGKKALKLAGNDMIIISERKEDLARIYVMLKEYDNALREIEYLLKNNTSFSLKFMQLDPVWKPLLEMPAFKKVIAGLVYN